MGRAIARGHVDPHVPLHVRAHPPPGAHAPGRSRRAFTIYDDGDTERLIAGIVKGLDVDPKRFPPKAMAAAIGKAKDR